MVNFFAYALCILILIFIFIEVTRPVARTNGNHLPAFPTVLGMVRGKKVNDYMKAGKENAQNQRIAPPLLYL